MNKIATQGIEPDILFIIDIDPVKGLEKEIVKDRFSAKGLEYHKRVRQGYLDAAKIHPSCKIISYIPNKIDEMQNQIRKYTDELFEKEK